MINQDAFYKKFFSILTKGKIDAPSTFKQILEILKDYCTFSHAYVAINDDNSNKKKFNLKVAIAKNDLKTFTRVNDLLAIKDFQKNLKKKIIFDNHCVKHKLGYAPEDLLLGHKESHQYKCMRIPICLLQDQQFVGVLSLVRRKIENDFTIQEGNIIHHLLQYYVLALERYRFKILNKTNFKRISTLIDISKYINSPYKEKKILDNILKRASNVLQANSSSIILIDKSAKELVFAHTSDKSKSASLYQQRFSINKGIAGYVSKTGKSEIVNDAQKDNRFFNRIDKKTKQTTKNLIAVPMRLKNKIIGVLEIINAKNPNGFDKYDLKISQVFADQAALVIDNHNLISNLKKVNHSLHFRYVENKTLNEINQKISKQGTNINFTCLAIIKKNYELVDALIKKSFDKQAQHSPAKIAFPIKNNLNQIEYFVFIRNFMQPFEEEEKESLKKICSDIEKIKETNYYYKEFLHKQKISKDLQTMRNLQEIVLPSTLPNSTHIDVAYTYKPTEVVGGDFYDYISINKKKHGFLIGDVSGKSLPASLFMTLARTTLHIEASKHNQKVHDTLKHTNKFIFKDSKNGMFVTAFYLQVDEANKKISYSNAGHNLPLYYQAKIDSFIYLEGHSTPLGVYPDAHYKKLGAFLHTQ